jgi:hypothetical protein
MTDAPKNLKQSLQRIPKVWRIFATLLLLLFLPFLGELLQRLIIGEEQVCCMPDNRDWLVARAAIARHLRLLSDLIIGGSILASIIMAIRTIILFFRETFSKLKPSSVKCLATIFITVFGMYVAITLITMLIFFILRNDLYFYDRPWPGGSLYDGAWYSPLHWLKATFANPFTP